MLASYLMAISILIVSAFKLRAVTDAFGIVKEFKQMGALAIFFLVSDRIISATTTTWNGTAASNIYSAISVGAVGVCISIGIPLYRSYYPALHKPSAAAAQSPKGEDDAATAGTARLLSGTAAGSPADTPHGAASAKRQTSLPTSTNKPSTSTVEELRTFEGVLRSIPGRRAFEKHLTYEFSIESLLFVRVIACTCAVALCERAEVVLIGL